MNQNDIPLERQAKAARIMDTVEFQKARQIADLMTGLNNDSYQKVMKYTVMLISSRMIVSEQPGQFLGVDLEPLDLDV